MVTTERTKYVLVFEPLPNVDGIRALRAVLKNALRRHGLKCIDIRAADSHERCISSLKDEELSQ